jgi:hypothetical protein
MLQAGPAAAAAAAGSDVGDDDQARVGVVVVVAEAGRAEVAGHLEAGAAAAGLCRGAA